MNNRLPALLLGLALLVPAASPAGDGEAPLEVDADRWEADQSREISVFQGDVVLRKGSIVIEADEARIQASDGRVRFGTIIGKPARFRQKPADAPEITGHAERMEYDAENDIVVLTGAAWVRQGNDEFSGETIRYDITAEKVLATAAEKTPQRVRIIFTPRDDQQDGEASQDNGNPGN